MALKLWHSGHTEDEATALVPRIAPEVTMTEKIPHSPQKHMVIGPAQRVVPLLDISAFRIIPSSLLAALTKAQPSTALATNPHSTHAYDSSDRRSTRDAS